jgi:carbamoyltransferase
MRNYIGLATGPHDPSLAVIDKNGTLVYAEATERPLQTKRAWGSAPDHINHIQSVLAQYCDPRLDVVAGMTWSKHLTRRYAFLLPYVSYKIRNAQDEDRNGLLTMKYMGLAHKSVHDLATAGLELALGASSTLAARRAITRRYFDHHLTHAAAAAFASPFREGICAVIDGFGESSSIAAFEFRDGRFERIKAVRAAHASLGFFYALMCETCGFDPLKGEEWKVMGLAAYGKFDQKVYDLIRPLIRVNGLSLEAGTDIEKNYSALYQMRRRPDVAALEYADFAATAQFFFTEIVHQLLRNLHGSKPSDNLILSGGCALNSSTNGTIVGNTPFKELFVNSAPADDGNSVGAAYLAYYADNPHTARDEAVLSPYLGSSMKHLALDNLRKYCGFRFEKLGEEDLIEATARALAEGKIVGWAQGRAEFGPRALGNRSILADPRRVGVKERINAEVKFREEFRPFAPSILHEYGDAYFENYQFSPYMERTLKFKDAMREKVPGVVHVDGTGRLQSVTAKINPRYYKLIKAFNAITGIPVLLNTSFNVMGKPIVHSVEDAAAVFQTSGLDLLVIDNTVFWKDGASQMESRKVHGQEVADVAVA